MNDIDILEELVNAYKDCFVENYNEMIVDVGMRYKDIQAISNLIAENKELKEMLKHRIEYTNKLEKDLFENASNYVIPKSKIKAKIEIRKEEKENCKDSIEEKYLLREIYVLQSLLGKGVDNGN